jgi:hypothetical protein
MRSCTGSRRGFAFAANDETGQMLFLAGGFVRSFSNISMYSRTVFTASSFERRVERRPGLVEGRGIGVGDFGHTLFLRYGFGELSFREHDLPQVTQNRTGHRGCLGVSGRPSANYIHTQKLR